MLLKPWGHTTVLNIQGAHAKIERAGEHREALEHEVRAWLESNPNAVSVRSTQHADTEKTRWSVHVGDVRPPNTQRWALIFGDAVHNLRCALDQVFFAIAEQYAPGVAVQQRTFPIRKHPNAFADFLKSRKELASAFPPGVWAAIEGEQPFKRQNGPTPPLLDLLNDLDIRDKHHALAGLLVVHPRAEWSHLERVGGSVEVFIVDNDATRGIASLEKGAEIASLVIHKPRPNMDPVFRLATTVAVDIGLPTGQPAAARVLLKILAAEIVAVIERVSKAVN